MFEKARLKLTAIYLIIIMAVSVTFSLVIYRVLLFEILRFEKVQRFRIERRIQFFNTPIPDYPELIDEIKQRIIFRLFIVNAGILVLSGGLGYYLAGRTLSPIKEMVLEQNRFISDASHELRTPLTSLKSALEVHLRDKKLSLNEARKLIAENINDVNKLQKLSDSLLQLAQFQTPDSKYKFEKVDIKQLTVESIRKLKFLADKKQIKFINKTQNIEITGNRDKLVDLLVILLDNAIKYSPSKQSVTIETRKSDGIVLLKVKDKGIGIEKKDTSFIFDRFYRAENSRSKKSADGYGLGLSIAKKIAELHHGEISVDSKVNSGTTFTVSLPENLKKLV